MRRTNISRIKEKDRNEDEDKIQDLHDRGRKTSHSAGLSSEGSLQLKTEGEGRG